MQITSARSPKYTADGRIDIDIQIDGMAGYIPFTADPNDPEPHGRELFTLAVAGEFGPIAAYVPPPAPTPDDLLAAERSSMTCSRFQAKAALSQAGLLEQVETLMADPTTPVITRLAWQDAQEFQRASPTIAAMAQALSLTDAQLDDLFRDAMGIVA